MAEGLNTAKVKSIKVVLDDGSVRTIDSGIVIGHEDTDPKDKATFASLNIILPDMIEFYIQLRKQIATRIDNNLEKLMEEETNEN
jgi:hypothetical protein